MDRVSGGQAMNIAFLRRLLPTAISRRALLAAGPALALSSAARAQAFPARPVRIVVPYSVGLGPDVVMRALADQLGTLWKQPITVDNRPGASGIVAMSEVRRVPPDGHTLFIGDAGSLCVNPLLHASLPYDPIRDFAPITTVFRATFCIFVGTTSKYASLAQLLGEARTEPGRVSYASLGNGHPSQLAVETFARAAGVRLLHVPFKEGGPMLTAVANRDVDFVTISMNTASGLVKAGRLKALAVAAAAKLKDFPDIPTVRDANGPAVDMQPWAALLASAGTPPEALDIVRRDVIASLAGPGVREKVEALGFEIIASTPDELAARIRSDAQLYATLVREGRVTPL